MPTERQIVAMVDGHGFHRTDHQWCVGFRRMHPDGRQQFLGVFWWSNKKVAAEKGIPNAYLVVCLALDGGEREVAARYRLPLVDWPSAEQARRPWRDVAEEFTTVFMSALNAPSTEGRKRLDTLSDRYNLYVL